MRILLAVFLLIFFVAIFFVYPAGDDYSLASLSLDYNIWDLYLHQYRTWSGRFVSNFPQALTHFFVDHLWFYRSFILFLLIFFTFSVSRLFSGCGKFAVCVPIIFLSACADLAQIFYWFTGGASYGLGLCFSILFTRGLIMKKHFAAILFLILSTGSAEVFIGINFLLIFALAGFKDKKWILYFAFWLAISLVIYLAPGTEVRSALFQNNHRVFYSAYMSAAQTIRFAGKALLFLPLPLAMIWIYINDFRWPAIEKLKSWQLFLLAFGPLFAACFMPYYATGILGQHRTPTVGQFYFISACLIFPVWLKNQSKWIDQVSLMKFYLKRRSSFLIFNSQFSIVRFTYLGMIAGFIFSGNSGNLIKEFISGSLQKNARLQQTRIDQIKESCQNKESTLYFEPLDTNALFVIDLSQNPNHWINIHQAKYLCPNGEIEIALEE